MQLDKEFRCHGARNIRPHRQDSSRRDWTCSAMQTSSSFQSHTLCMATSGFSVLLAKRSGVICRRLYEKQRPITQGLQTFAERKLFAW